MNVIRAERIQGFMQLPYLEWFAKQAKKHKRIVEIGCYRGRTTTVLCENCPGTVTAVDPWIGSPGIMEDIENMQRISGDSDWLYHEFCYNMSDFKNLEVYRMSSLEAAAEFASQGRLFDFVFIDGLHDYESVRADLAAWAPRVAPGGMLCGHDLQHPPVRQALEESFPFLQVPDTCHMWAVVAPEVVAA